MEGFKKWVHDALEHKKYIDFITAALSVPIMTVVLATNISSFTNKDQPKVAQKEEKISPAPVVTEIIKIIPVAATNESVEKESTDEAYISPAAATSTTTIIITTVPPTYTPYPTYTPMPTTVVTATPTPTHTQPTAEPTQTATSAASLSAVSPQPTQTQ